MRRGREERDQLDAVMARAVKRALLEAEPRGRKPTAAAGGDPVQLRGIPVVGRGCGGGAILGTNPRTLDVRLPNVRTIRYGSGRDGGPGNAPGEAHSPHALRASCL